MTVDPRLNVIVGVLVSGRRPEVPGEYQFQNSGYAEERDPERIERILFICPVGGKLCSIGPIGKKRPYRRPSWQVSGTLERPTLYPELRTRSGWRGRLHDGKFLAESSR